MYREHDVSVARGASLGHDSCIGAHTVIDEDAQVLQGGILAQDTACAGAYSVPSAIADAGMQSDESFRPWQWAAVVWYGLVLSCG